MISVEELVAALDAGARPEYVLFWGHTARHGAAIGPWLFSQWWPHTFEADGETFGSAEHYMMWRKARLFGDHEMAERIVATTDPRDAKALGREIRGFDGETWAEHRFEIVTDASRHKFGQHDDLRAWLVGTGDRVLVEASPTDRVWGIGLAAADERAADPARWRGLNLLGFALMRARHEWQSEHS